jgi:hypothetical protein
MLAHQLVTLTLLDPEMDCNLFLIESGIDEVADRRLVVREAAQFSMSILPTDDDMASIQFWESKLALWRKNMVLAPNVAAVIILEEKITMGEQAIAELLEKRIT